MTFDNLIKDFSLMCENTSCVLLETACVSALGITPSRNKLLVGLWFELFDAGDAFDQADVLLKNAGQEESAPFCRDFDVRPFAVSLDVFPQDVIASQGIMLPFADHCATILSATLGKRVLVMLNSGDIPYRLYGDGVLQDDYTRYRLEL
ncbi:MAG: hypothetical protein HN350_02665 [Phycisphaerales bacterium]|jgi:hypothetical protein|nr:hypothetical protein [Phycisphaerales bacterium]